MESVLPVQLVVGLLVVLGGLALVGWVGLRSAARHGAVPARVEDGRLAPAGQDWAAVLAVGLERAEGLAGLGRHDERRCAY
jgi:hypothetical protein